MYNINFIFCMIVQKDEVIINRLHDFCVKLICPAIWVATPQELLPLQLLFCQLGTLHGPLMVPLVSTGQMRVMAGVVAVAG